MTMLDFSLIVCMATQHLKGYTGTLHLIYFNMNMKRRIHVNVSEERNGLASRDKADTLKSMRIKVATSFTFKKYVVFVVAVVCLYISNHDQQIYMTVNNRNIAKEQSFGFFDDITEDQWNHYKNILTAVEDHFDEGDPHPYDDDAWEKYFIWYQYVSYLLAHFFLDTSLKCR